MRNITPLLCLLSTIIFSCKSDKEVEPSLPLNYTSSKIASNLPIQGGIVDQNDLLTFALPLYDDNYSQYVVKPALYKVTATGGLSKQYEFSKGNFGYGGYKLTTRDNYTGWQPIHTRVNVVKNSKSEIFISNKFDLSLSVTKITPDGISCDIALPGVMAMTMGLNDTIYALTAQTYYNSGDASHLNYKLLEPMKLWKIAPDCSVSEFYSFPESFIYPEGGSSAGSYQTGMRYLDYEADLCMTQQGELLVSLLLAGKIYKVTKNKQVVEFITSIDQPISITTDKYDNVYVVSAPAVEKNEANEFKLTKPVQIYRVRKQQAERIYQGELALPNIPAYYYISSQNRWYISDLNYNINVTKDLKIYLENLIAGELLLLQ